MVVTGKLAPTWAFHDGAIAPCMYCMQLRGACSAPRIGQRGQGLESGTLRTVEMLRRVRRRDDGPGDAGVSAEWTALEGTVVPFGRTDSERDDPDE
jgi:hypothetical protein